MNSYPSNFPGEAQADWSSVILCSGLIISCCLERWAAKLWDRYLNVVLKGKKENLLGVNMICVQSGKKSPVAYLGAFVLLSSLLHPLHGWMEQRVSRDKHGENRSGWSSASLKPAGNQTVIFSHLRGSTG